MLKLAGFLLAIGIVFPHFFMLYYFVRYFGIKVHWNTPHRRSWSAMF